MLETRPPVSSLVCVSVWCGGSLYGCPSYMQEVPASIHYVFYLLIWRLP